ncbi:hypothetical protein QT974_25850 [Microcoleus sp. herbarium12]
MIAISMAEVQSASIDLAWICQWHPARSIIGKAALPTHARTGATGVTVTGGLAIINHIPSHAGRSPVNIAIPIASPPAGDLASDGRTGNGKG